MYVFSFAAEWFACELWEEEQTCETVSFSQNSERVDHNCFHAGERVSEFHLMLHAYFQGVYTCIIHGIFPCFP